MINDLVWLSSSCHVICDSWKIIVALPSPDTDVVHFNIAAVTECTSHDKCSQRRDELDLSVD